MGKDHIKFLSNFLMQHTEASIYSLKRHHHVVHFVHRKDMPHGVRLESDGIGDAEGDTVGKPFSHTEKDEDNWMKATGA